MNKFTSRIDRRFPCTTAEESRKPGYLKDKFDRLIREAKAKATAKEAEQSAKVRKIRRDANERS